MSSLRSNAHTLSLKRPPESFWQSMAGSSSLVMATSSSQVPYRYWELVLCCVLQWFCLPWLCWRVVILLELGLITLCAGYDICDRLGNFDLSGLLCYARCFFWFALTDNGCMMDGRKDTTVDWTPPWHIDNRACLLLFLTAWTRGMVMYFEGCSAFFGLWLQVNISRPICGRLILYMSVTYSLCMLFWV